MDKEKQLQLIERLADRMVYGGDADWAMNIGQFDWVPGVGLYGIWHALFLSSKIVTLLSKIFLKNSAFIPRSA